MKLILDAARERDNSCGKEGGEKESTEAKRLLWLG